MGSPQRVFCFWRGSKVILWLIWLLALLTCSFATGIIKGLLGIKSTSPYKYGVFFYGIISTFSDLIIGYCLLSAVLGHWLL